MPIVVRRRLLAAAAVMVLLFCAGLACTDVVYGPWDRDGGFYLLHSDLIARGLRPYLDYPLIYPPLILLFDAPLVALPTSRLALAILIPALWILGCAAATVALFRAVTRRWTAALAGAGLYLVYCVENDGNHVTLELGVVFFACLALAVAVRPEPPSPGRFALCGFLASAASLCKQNGLVVLLPLAAILIPRAGGRPMARLVAFLLGSAALPLAVLAWLDLDIRAVFTNLFTDVAGYAEATIPDAGWRNELQRAPTTVLLLALGAAITLWLMARYSDLRLTAAAALIAAVIELLPRLVRNYPHYNLNAWPFLALLFALALSRAKPRFASLATGALLVIVLTYATTLAAGRFQFTDSTLLRLNPVARTLAAVTPPSDVVRQYGAEPILEFLACRQPELIEEKRATWRRWDGSEVYPTPPAHSTTVVVVDRGQPWTASTIAKLETSGFARVEGRAGVDAGPSVGRISIFRHR